MVKPLWLPDAETERNSNIAKFVEFIGAESNSAVDDWASLYAFSIDEPERF